MPRQLEGEVRLDGDTQLDRAIGIIVPTAFGKLLSEEVTCGLADFRVALPTHEGHEKDIFGFEDGIALEFTDPVAVGALPCQKTAAHALNGPLQGRRMARIVLDSVNGPAQAMRRDCLCAYHGDSLQTPSKAVHAGIVIYRRQ